jgi:ribose transport system substrate-binding protein
MACVGILAASEPHPIHAVAVTLAEEGGAYYDQVVRGAEHAVREMNPDIRFVAVSCKNNPGLQAQQLDDFVRQGVELILIQRAYVGDVSPAVQRARRAGVTVVAMDADVPGGTDALVKPDERQGGRLAGRALTSRLQGRGKVAIAHGPSTAAPLALRVAGFLEELRTSPGISVVENVDTGHTQSTIRAAMAGFLDRHPDLAAVYCVHDPRAHFCELEALARKRTNLVIIGMEGSPNSVASMKNPRGLIVASPASDPYALAETAVHIGAKVRGGSEPAGSVILVPFTPLDRDHLSGNSGWTR